MLNLKHYMEIDNLKYKVALKFHEGDEIIIQEKIDGSNASFQYDAAEDCLQCFSRNYPLNSENNLRGLYQWVQALDKKQVHAVLGDHLRMFGEWLVSHKVPYPAERYHTLYCFDVFDMVQQCYLPQQEVRRLAEQLRLHYVPVFYEGKFTKWEDYMPLVGKTALGGEIGEGIVIKNMNTLHRNVAYTKIVHENFAEVQCFQRRKADTEKVKEHQRLIDLTATIVTKQRVEKQLYKLVDEGILPENFSAADKKTIFRHLPSAVYYDCLREEPEVTSQIKDFGKYCGAALKRHLEEILEERGHEHR